MFGKDKLHDQYPKKGLVRMLIVSCDGGAQRGYIQALALQHLFTDTKTLRDKCDLMIGTSTGAIVTCLAAMPEYSLPSIVELYQDTSLLKTSYMQRAVRSVSIRSMLTTDTHKKKSSDLFDYTRLKDLEMDVAVMSYEMMDNKPIMFTNKSHPDSLVADIIMCSTSAPGIFPPTKMGDGVYIDALAAKNPVLYGIQHFLENGGRREGIQDIKILSLGTGIKKRRDTYPLETGSSYIDNVIDSLFFGSGHMCNDFVKILLPEKNVLRIDPVLEDSCFSLFDLGKKELDLMKCGLYAHMEAQRDTIEAFVKAL